jgi:hypothetical protein
MHVAAPQVSATLAGKQRLSASVDGFDLWFETPLNTSPAAPGDVFLSAALLVAMKAGETLTVDARCSTCLLRAARGPIQEIFAGWYPSLSRVSIIADEIATPPSTNHVGSFFSGGVDGTYTFLRHRDEITHLISVQGIDVQVDNDAQWAEVIEANRRFADTFSKTLVNVKTNIRSFCHPRGVDWTILHGAGLAAIAHAVGLPHCYVASSHAYPEMFPWGSHPMTDHLWSSDCVKISHDAPAPRSTKIKALADFPEALAMLRVCWQDAGYNCGRCEKCIRTRVALQLLGLRVPTLPPIQITREIAALTVWGANDESYFLDNLALAESVGNVRIARALRRCISRFRTRRALADLDQYLFGGIVRRIKSLVRR